MVNVGRDDVFDVLMNELLIGDEGCVVKANMPQHRYLSGGWYDIPLASKGRVGLPSPRQGCWGCGGCFTPSIVYGRDLQVEEGGRVALSGLMNVGS